MFKGDIIWNIDEVALTAILIKDGEIYYQKKEHIKDKDKI